MRNPYLLLSALVCGLGFGAPFIAWEVNTPGTWTAGEVLVMSGLAAGTFGAYFLSLAYHPPTKNRSLLWRLSAVSGTLAIAGACVFVYALVTQ